MLIVSTPDEDSQAQIVGLGAVASSTIPTWAPDTATIVAVVGADPADVHLSFGVDCQTTDMETEYVERLLPFESNLRTGRRAPRRQQPVLSGPDPSWQEQADRLIARIRNAIGPSVRRIDHIGSTSVPGLPAKNLIDIQVVVDDLAVALEMAMRVRRAGFVRVSGDWYGEDRNGTAFREEVVVDADPGRPVNVNIRPISDPVWRDVLLFRDLLRKDPPARDSYAEMKRALMAEGVDVNRYSELKMPFIREALRSAEA